MKKPPTQTELDTARADSRLKETAAELSAMRENRRKAIYPSVESGVTVHVVSEFSSTNNPMAGGGSGAAGVEIIWADETEPLFISKSTILEDYDDDEYWSVVLDVSENTFTKDVSYDATDELFDDTGSNQTVYRLRIKTLGVNISALGQYREVILCINGDPVTTLIKTS